MEQIFHVQSYEIVSLQKKMTRIPLQMEKFSEVYKKALHQNYLDLNPAGRVSHMNPFAILPFCHSTIQKFKIIQTLKPSWMSSTMNPLFGIPLQRITHHFQRLNITRFMVHCLFQDKKRKCFLKLIHAWTDHKECMSLCSNL